MKQRKQLKSAGSFILDKDGKEIPFNPKEHAGVANACAAVVKTIETGQQWQVIA